MFADTSVLPTSWLTLAVYVVVMVLVPLVGLLTKRSGATRDQLKPNGLSQVAGTGELNTRNVLDLVKSTIDSHHAEVSERLGGIETRQQAMGARIGVLEGRQPGALRDDHELPPPAGEHPQPGPGSV